MSAKNQKKINNNRELSSRLMAVQAYYQIAHNDKPMKIIVQEYLARGLEMDIDGEEMPQPHGGLFKRILFSLDDRLSEVSEILKSNTHKKELPEPIVAPKADKVEEEVKDVVSGDDTETTDEVKGADSNTEKTDEISSDNEYIAPPPPREKELEPLLKAILLCGICELLAHQDIDAPLIIDDYLNVTHAFYEQPQVSFVNGILGKVTPILRA